MATGTGLPPLRDVIARYGLSARKGLGQHFLLDENLTDRIARAAGDLTGVHVVEVGPGPGGLTRALLRQPCARVVAIERDPRCVEALRDLADHHGDRLQVIEGDALETDPEALVPAPRAIVANLPYNVSIPLILAWLRRSDAYAGMTLMVQKEVADRLAAATGSKAFGRLSVMAQWRCDVRQAFTVGPKAFVPPPKVTSAVVRLTPPAGPRGEADWKSMEAVTAAAFGQRRKMLRSSLRSVRLDPAVLGLDPTIRAEDLDVDGFCALARAYSSGQTAR